MRTHSFDAFLSRFLGKAILGLTLVWAINWLFFDLDNRHTRHALTRNFYFSIHLLNPLIIAIAYNFAMNFVVTGLTLAGATLPQVVVASDCPNSPIDSLTDKYAALSVNPLPQYLRWYFCGGLAVGVMSMGTLHPANFSLTYCIGLLQLLHKPHKISQRIELRWRILIRFATTISWCFLPLAKANLNSVNLMAIITGSCYICLFVEIYGQDPVGSNIFEWKNDWHNGYNEVDGGDYRMLRTMYGHF